MGERTFPQINVYPNDHAHQGNQDNCGFLFVFPFLIFLQFMPTSTTA